LDRFRDRANAREIAYFDFMVRAEHAVIRDGKGGKRDMAVRLDPVTYVPT
jgi:hypothetical protein